MKVLLAEDDKNLGRLLSMLLKKQNIDVTWAEDGEAAYQQVYNDGYDVLVLDWMMPKLSGVDLAKRLRDEEYEGKILLLTAKDTISDKVMGLNMGADDYLVKPFDMAELVARLNALCRRHGTYASSQLSFGEYILDSSTYSLIYRGMRVELRPREFKILELLVVNKGQIIPRNVLLDRVWGLENDVTENNLDVHIRLLRKKITGLSGEEIIKTVRGVGYYVE
ncbi:MAG: response regulator transcription factor [Phascolarctobacterium sp.]|nr:response regulator transcription factor [Phascolarctobacterium sp.]